MTQVLEAARAATMRHEWSDVLVALEPSEPDLSPDELRLKADALWWLGRPEDAVEAMERAYSALVDQGRPTEAAEVGGLLAYAAMRRQAYSVAGGWVGRMTELLEGQPESPGHAWLKLLNQAFALFAQGDWAQTAALGEEAEELAGRLGMSGMRAIAMSFRGYALIEMGRWKEGMALVDQATVVAMAEGADLRMAADVYCNTIAACRNLADYGRAAEWTEEAERWMRERAVSGYPGVCQVHRAELKRLHGSWNEAEEEAKRACRQLERHGLLDAVGFAHYEVAEVRRRMGDLTTAERALEDAYEYGHKGQPGLALMMLDQGDVDGAARSINQTIEKIRDRDGEITDSGTRKTSGYMLLSRLLPSQVEIAIAAGDIDSAEQAASDLEEMATVFEGRSWLANAAAARGRVELARGNADRAVEELSKAWRLWAEIDLPYEAASVRVALGEALRDGGDERGALREWKAARSAFDRLGARSELTRVEELMGDDAPGAASTTTRMTKAFMFTDIVTSTDLIGLIGDSAWEELLEWHDRALREEFAAADGTEVRHTGDGFFVTFDSARSGIECAVAIQRRLANHRRSHGFAPTVRIGLHQAEATFRGKDYSGQGVHTAARISGTAEAEQIVVSTTTLEAAGKVPFPASNPESVELKGVDEPVAVQRIDWR